MDAVTKVKEGQEMMFLANRRRSIEMIVITVVVVVCFFEVPTAYLDMNPNR